MDFLTPTLPYIRWLQQFHFLLLPMKFFSALGTEICYLALLPLIYWAVSRPLGARLGVLLLFSAIVNEIFKVGFACPRPYWLDPSLQLSAENSFGFPSGHAQNAWLLWPFLALQTRNRKLWISLAIALAFCITISRNYLGVHFPADSIGGALIGLSILLCARYGGAAWMRFWHQLPTIQRVIFTGFASLFLFGIYAMAMYRGTSPYINGYGNWAGAEYQTAIQNALAGGQISSRLGGFCGLIIGVTLANRFAAARAIIARIPAAILAPRLALGFVGMALFYVGIAEMGKRFGGGDGWSFARYFFTTGWIAFGAPLLFERVLPVREIVPSE